MTMTREAYIELGELSPADIEERHERTRDQLELAYFEVEKVIEASEAMFDELKLGRIQRANFFGGMLDSVSDVLHELTGGDSAEVDHADHEGPAFKRARQLYREWDEEQRHVAMMRAGGVVSQIEMVCARCGSDDVTCDAQVEWDASSQHWLILNVLDHGDCVVCDETALIVERPVQVERAEGAASC